MNLNLRIKIPENNEIFKSPFDEFIIAKTKVNYFDRKFNIFYVRPNNQIDKFINNNNTNKKYFVVSPLLSERIKLTIRMIRAIIIDTEFETLVPVGFDGFYVEISVYKTNDKKLYMIEFNKDKIVDCFQIE